MQDNIYAKQIFEDMKKYLKSCFQKPGKTMKKLIKLRKYMKEKDILFKIIPGRFITV